MQAGGVAACWLTLGVQPSWRTHVDLGAEPEPGGPVRIIEVENYALTRTQHAERGTSESVGGEVELLQPDVGEDDTVPRRRIVELHYTLHPLLPLLGCVPEAACMANATVTKTTPPIASREIDGASYRK